MSILSISAYVHIAKIKSAKERGQTLVEYLYMAILFALYLWGNWKSERGYWSRRRMLLWIACYYLLGFVLLYLQFDTFNIVFVTGMSLWYLSAGSICVSPPPAPWQQAAVRLLAVAVCLYIPLYLVAHSLTLSLYGVSYLCFTLIFRCLY